LLALYKLLSRPLPADDKKADNRGFDRMVDMRLPKPIADFFEMKNAHDDEGLWTLFASDAVIIDGGEGTEIHGADEIKKWIKKAISGLNLHTEIKSFEQRDHEWVIDTVMSGDFNASPARFQYFIIIEDEKISALRSEFLGSLK
jgi:hypothetical protein